MRDSNIINGRQKHIELFDEWMLFSIYISLYGCYSKGWLHVPQQNGKWFISITTLSRRKTHEVWITKLENILS